MESMYLFFNYVQLTSFPASNSRIGEYPELPAHVSGAVTK